MAKTARSSSRCGARRPALKLLVIGNVVLDRTPRGLVPGGPSLYSAAMARALGAQVTLVTTLAPDYPEAPLAGLDLRTTPALSSPIYENRYDAAGNRTQLLLDRGQPIPPEAIPSGPFDAVLLAPAYHEVLRPPAVEAHVRAVALQGLLRTTRGRRVVPRANPLAAVKPFLAPNVIAFFSVEDTREPAALAEAIGRTGAIACLTDGERGVVLFCGGRARPVPAIPARAIEPTGAGDCFAATYVVRLAESGDDHAAALRHALAAGALAVEGIGLAGVPTRAAVERRAREAAA